MKIIEATMNLRSALLNSGVRPTSISTIRVTMPALVFDLLQRTIIEEIGMVKDATAGQSGEFELAGFTFARHP